ncbi:MAG: fibronectin type III domain-containing protein [Planctomycetes bacterium]|nr:fibronectin type III domain-containing protein [Planctomycetota bacterium]
MGSPRRPALLALLAAVGCFLAAPFAWAGAEVGIDMMAPIDTSTGHAGPNTDPDLLASTHARWVRINYILGPSSTPEPTFAVYDAIVNGVRSRGVRVYMLLGAETYHDPGDLFRAETSPDPGAAEAWIQGFASHCVQVIDHFKDRVRHFEIYNEPNDWAGGTTSKLHPKWFARILQEVYLNVKQFNGHAADPAWRVTLVSGALFSFDGTTAADYASGAYWYGKNVWAWDWTHAETGSYPLDGFGYHVYVAQDSTHVAAAVDGNVTAFWNACTAYEGAGTAKRVWISEFGWQSDIVGLAGQADALTDAFHGLKADARVAAAFWFGLGDFASGDGVASWGIFEAGGFGVANRKPSFAAFQAAAGPPLPPIAPTVLSPAWPKPGNYVSGSSMTLSWHAVANATGYQVYVQVYGAGAYKYYGTWLTGLGATSTKLWPQKKKTWYRWWVRAKNAGGWGAWSSWTPAGGAPGGGAEAYFAGP